jgi:glycosyltransferase involved in cell wall biosynthesis
MIKPLIVMPSYNSGALLESTVRSVLVHTQQPLLVIIDGSDDHSESNIVEMAAGENQLEVILKSRNEGKGAAVRTGLERAKQTEFTHALVMDADGQHPVSEIDTFIAHAELHPESMILGQPVFGDDVPLERLYGRKLSVWMVQLEVMSRVIGDPLFGFRVYPIDPLLKVMAKPGRSNRYDFDPEVAVRLIWMGIPAFKVNAAVEYIEKEHGGISHFHYLRDNARFVVLHVRLLLQAPFHWISQLFRSNVSEL